MIFWAAGDEGVSTAGVSTMITKRRSKIGKKRSARVERAIDEEASQWSSQHGMAGGRNAKEQRKQG